MNHHSRFIIMTLMLTLSASVFAAGSSSKSAGFKCWKNKEGIRECGNEVPPEFAQGETQTVNKHGMTTKVEERAKTAAEAEQRAKEQQQKDRAEQAANAKRKEQEAYDRVLIASYLSEEDINAARNRKVSAIDASIALSTSTIEKLQEKQKKEESKQKGGKAISDEDKKDIEALHKQIADKQAFIAIKQKEKDAVGVEYDGYVNRFRELKGKKN